MYLLALKNVSKKVQVGYVVRNISFTQNEGKKIAIAGATGSGKTTLLKMIAGLVQPSSGNIYFNEKKINGPDEQLIPGHPKIAYLSQHFELRNHYRVSELLEMANPRSTKMVANIAAICKINHLTSRYTHQLSGGERQRIALAITLVSAPELLLLDEPYSNLDAIHKNILKEVIDDVCENLHTTCILVSHCPVDTLSWADEIIVLRDGKIVQQSAPTTIYLQPVNEYTAALFGSYNVFTPALTQTFNSFARNYNPELRQFIRPEQIIVTSRLSGVKAIVKTINFMGNFYKMEIDVEGHKLIVHTTQQHSPGDVVFVSLNFEDVA